jgi:hypothetical protein
MTTTMKPDWLTTEEHERWVRVAREACDVDPALKDIVASLPHLLESTAASCWLEAETKQRGATDVEVKNLCMDVGKAWPIPPWVMANGLLVLWMWDRAPATEEASPQLDINRIASTPLHIAR